MSKMGDYYIWLEDEGREDSPEAREAYKIFDADIRGSDVWPGWIRGGVPTYIVGQGGIGTSLLVTDLIARVSRDGVMPDGRQTRSGRVVHINVEETDSLQRERFLAAGANLSRVTKVIGDVTVPDSLPELSETVAQTGRVRLVAFDPLGPLVTTSLYGGPSPLAGGTAGPVSAMIAEPLSLWTAGRDLGLVAVVRTRKGKEMAGKLADGLFSTRFDRVVLQVSRYKANPDLRVLQSEDGREILFRIACGPDGPHVEYLVEDV
jgi:AAA domain